MQNLDSTGLGGLERQIDTLLQTIHQLRLENGSLRNRLVSVETDLASIEQKNQRAAEKIKKLILQLKEDMA